MFAVRARLRAISQLVVPRVVGIVDGIDPATQLLESLVASGCLPVANPVHWVLNYRSIRD